MNDLLDVAPAFIEMAHRIVWCSAATVDHAGRPRSRVLHPIWQWNGTTLVGWVATDPTSPKAAHLEHAPFLSCNYWAPSQDTCVAECHAELLLDDPTCAMLWDLFMQTPEPLGYDPGGIGVPGWDSPTSSAFAVIRLRPWRLRVATISELNARWEILAWREEQRS
jgi:hypothetical protein